MKKGERVVYEWDIETIETEYGDIEDHDHFDALTEYARQRLNDMEPGRRKQLVLVRNVGSDAEGLTDRSWAYVEGGKLPVEFDDGHNVPKRFHAELKKWNEEVK